MIHSMSGGVLAENKVNDFAKVKVGDVPAWYLSLPEAKEGDKVLVPFGGGTREGVIERIERCDTFTAPVSPRRAKRILCILGKNA